MLFLLSCCSTCAWITESGPDCSWPAAPRSGIASIPASRTVSPILPAVIVVLPGADRTVALPRYDPWFQVTIRPAERGTRCAAAGTAIPDRSLPPLPRNAARTPIIPPRLRHDPHFDLDAIARPAQDPANDGRQRHGLRGFPFQQERPLDLNRVARPKPTLDSVPWRLVQRTPHTAIRRLVSPRDPESTLPVGVVHVGDVS